MISIPQRYRLSPGPTRATFTLLPQEGVYFTVGGNPEPVQSFSRGEVGRHENEPVWFTVYSPTGLAAARVEVVYDAPLMSLEWRPPSCCHLYFKPGGLDWIWSGAAIAGDNVSILASGEGPHGDSTITLRPPTRPNGGRAGRQFPFLDSSRVSLLDRNGTGNMIFRGNQPLAPGAGNQLIDFDALHETLKFSYFSHTGFTDFPEKGRYVLRDIALLDSQAEGKMLQRELMSFGGSEIGKDLKNRSWYPAAPAAMSASGIRAQMAHWPISQADALSESSLDFIKLAAAQLRGSMSRQEALPHIYYIHCADGHERSGVMAAWYLLTNRDMSLSEAYMLGAALNGLPAGL